MNFVPGHFVLFVPASRVIMSILILKNRTTKKWASIQPIMKTNIEESDINVTFFCLEFTMETIKMVNRININY